MNSIQELLETVSNPPSAYGACYVWSWNAPVTHEESRRQLDAMLKARIRSICIIPLPPEFRPDTMASELKPDYLSDAYFDEIRYAVEYAASKGMTVWLYDEGGWPSGYACTQIVKKYGHKLGKKQIRVDDFLWKRGTAFAFPEVEEYDSVIAAFSKNPVKRIAEGEVAAEDTEVWVFVSHATSKDNPYLQTDIADRRVTDAFLEMTHEGYYKAVGQYFGNVSPLMFDDEANIHNLSWTPKFVQRFREEYGYDVRDFMPYIADVLPCETEEQRCAKRDYRLLQGVLVRENFFLPIRDWCRKHGIASGGHLNGEHTTDYFCRRQAYGAPLETLRCFDVPGVDVIWRQLWRTDHSRRDFANPIFPRYAASAAAQTGNAEVLAEALGVYGEGILNDDIRWLCNFLGVRGVNLFNFFGTAYGTEKFHNLVERPVFDPIKPGFSDMRRLNEVLERTTAVLHFGKPDVNHAVYLPLNDLTGGGETADLAEKAYDTLTHSLERNHVDFDIIDDAWIRSARLENGVLYGEHVSYESVFVPECRDIPADVRVKLFSVNPPEMKPLIICEDEDTQLQARKRVSGSESVVFIVNQSGSAYTGDITVDAQGTPYRLSMSDGKLYRIGGESVSSGILFRNVSILAGEELVLLFSDDEKLASMTVSEPAFEVLESFEIDSFEARMVSQTMLTPSGVEREITDGAEWISLPAGRWYDAFGEDFSGTVRYRFQITLGNVIRPGMFCELKPLGLEHTAEVFVNGKSVGILGFSTDTVRFVPDSRELKIELAVSNSFANQLVAVDARKFWPDYIVGPYHDRQVNFEKEVCGGGITKPLILTCFAVKN